MATRMAPSRAFKPIEVEIQEIQKEIIEEGGLSNVDTNATHYFVEVKGSDGERQRTGLAGGPPHYTEFLHIP